MSFGTEIYNSSGQLFYKGDYTGDYMTLYKIVRGYSASNWSNYNTGIPADRKCIVFFKYKNNTNYIVHQLVVNGYWCVTNGGVVDNLDMYIFSDMPVNTPSLAYGVEIYNSKGECIINNGTKPLQFTQLSWNRGQMPSTTYPYEIASTVGFFGIENAQWFCIGLFFVAKGRYIVTSVAEGLPPEWNNYYWEGTLLVLNTADYD